jgi:hypothetical protein
MKVITINGNGGNDYDVAVHRADCKDVKKDIRGHDYFEEEFETKRDLWLDYNSDFLAEGGEEAAWPIHFHACTAAMPDGGHYGKA